MDEPVERLLAWLYRDELRHSRLIWRLESDLRRDPPWTPDGLWLDPAGAALVDLSDHPTLGGGRPWFQAAADDGAALELLAALRLPEECEILLDQAFRPVIECLGAVESAGALEVWACAPGELGEAALPFEPTRLTIRHRALAAADDWRADDLDEECDESRGGVRWAIIREDRLAARLLVQPVSAHVAEIADLHVAEDRRRRGYGAGLVQAVVRRLHERGLTVTYSVHPSNAASRAVAAAVGFTPRFTWERYVVRRKA